MFRDNPHHPIQSDDSFGQMTLAGQRRNQLKWDRRFIDLMNVVGSWSKDPSTKVGAVIVRPDRTVVSVGYNGFPRGMSDHTELYEDKPTKYSRIVHGEMNAILNAHGSVEGCTLYVPFSPCDRCAAHVVQAGITRVVYEEPTDDILSRWEEPFRLAAAIFKDAGTKIVVLPREPVSTDPFLGEQELMPDSVDITVKVIDQSGQVEAINRQIVDRGLSIFVKDVAEFREKLAEVGAAALNAARGR